MGADFIDNGDFYRHIRRVRRIYAERRKLLIELVEQKLSPYATFHDHQAGMHVAIELGGEFDDQAIALAAQTQGVQVAPLSSHYGVGVAKTGLLLGFCPFDEAEIRHNLEVLTAIIEAQAETG